MQALNRREYELLTLALRRYADIERTDCKFVTAQLLVLAAEDIERKPLRIVA